MSSAPKSRAYVRRGARMALLTAFLLEPFASVEAQPVDDRKPNVVLITLDTLRADHLGCYGHPTARTPNIDRLAASSLRFTRATTVNNNTLPSHAAMMIGTYPHGFGLPRNGFRLPPEHATLATILGENGYDTAAFISSSALESSTGLSRGFDLYDEAFDTQEIDQFQRRAGTTTTAALHWLASRTADHPFFLWIHYFDSHYPYTPPPPYDRLFYPEYEGPADGSIPFICSIQGTHGFATIERSNDDFRRLIALYDGEIAYLDAELGGVLDVLESETHRRQTLVILTADHGESLTEHDYYFDHGRDVYQPSMHVPLIVRPAEFNSDADAGVSTGQVETIDIFTTVLNQASVTVPPGMDGVDLLAPTANGPRTSFGEACRPWDVEKIFPHAWPNAAKAQFALQYPYKLIVTPHQRKIELYRLDRDPNERTDLAKRHPDVVRQLQGQLQEWRRGIQDPATEEDSENVRRIRSLGYVR